jgi:hypothetical protein
MGGQLHASTALPRGKSTPPPPPSTHWIQGWVGPRVGLEAVEKRKISCPCQEQNPGHPARRYTN